MDSREVARTIHKIGIIPVVRASSPDEACCAVDAICEGCIPILEITMTVPDAISVIREIVRRFGGSVLCGAGTVLSTTQAEQCFDAGAEFLVSPGLSVPVLNVARKRGKLAIPGALTPTEVMMASDHGVNLIKIFPCSSAGGPKHISSLRAPFPHISFIPTGGVNLSNAEEYLKAGAFALGVGADLVDLNSIRAGNIRKVIDMAKALTEVVANFRSEMTGRKSAEPVRQTGGAGSQ